jgi:hypothetical protein
MRRKKTDNRDSFRPFDAKRDLYVAQLCNIGAISLTWNYIEYGIDCILGIAVKIPNPMWDEVTSRINGFDGKVAILKKAAKVVYKMPEHYLRMIADTLGAIEEHKRYRDGIIHANIRHPESPTAETAKRRGVVDEILVTDEALTALYERLCFLREEIDQLTYVYFCAWLYGEKEYSRKKRLIVEEMKACTIQLRVLQTERKALSPLPRFPEKLPTLKNWEDSEFLRGLNRSVRKCKPK